jgi:hypothetical protein
MTRTNMDLSRLLNDEIPEKHGWKNQKIEKKRIRQWKKSGSIAQIKILFSHVMQKECVRTLANSASDLGKD